MKTGSMIRVEISHPDGLIVLLGKVQWAKKVPACVIHKIKGGMGVEIISFLSREEQYRSLCDDFDAQRGE